MAKAKQVWSQHLDTRYGDLCCRFNEETNKYDLFLKGTLIKECFDRSSGVEFLNMVYEREDVLSEYVERIPEPIRRQTKSVKEMMYR